MPLLGLYKQHQFWAQGLLVYAVSALLINVLQKDPVVASALLASRALTHLPLTILLSVVLAGLAVSDCGLSLLQACVSVLLGDQVSLGGIWV